MPSATSPSVKYRTPLRQARRDLMRSRIVNAARNLFYEHHYDATTMDEIALAAGMRRSTLYLHYKDKNEILAEVISDYTPKAQRTLATMPGPNPSLRRLERWIEKVAKFVASERVPLSIILELRRSPDHAVILENLTTELLAGLGEKSPLFRAAAGANAKPLLRARALMLLQELTYACEVYLDDAGNAVGKALLWVAAEDFHNFLSQQGG
jgi:AcrR family transcriptional regulator